MSKGRAQFREELDAIISGTSIHHRAESCIDFQGFAFPEADFSRMTFDRDVTFTLATFTQKADFSGTTFTGEACFFGASFYQEAEFRNATFNQKARFNHVRFTQRAIFIFAKFTHEANFFFVMFPQGAHFNNARFDDRVYFNNAHFGGIKNSATYQSRSHLSLPFADFSHSEFLKPDLVSFRLVNLKPFIITDTPGFLANFSSCKIEKIHFEAVNWHRQNGRIVLHDEIAVMSVSRQYEISGRYEVVAATYRQLVNNFENARAYGLAEECMIGAMEMKRLDPANFLFAEQLSPYYEKWSWLDWIGKHVSLTNLYRLASNYGSSYVRAFEGLALLLLVFTLMFTLSGVSQNPHPNAGALAPAGLIHTIEIVTFQNPTRYVASSGLAWILEQVERPLIATQVALFLLALRRRFRC